MASIRLSPEMDIRQYVASLDLNPDNVFYQRVRSNNVSTSGAQWQITSPNKRSLLLNYAAVDWGFQVTKTDTAGTAQNFTSSNDQLSMKEVFPFSNAMTSQTVSVNGNSLTVSQPKRFMEPLARMCVSRQESYSCYESGWWNSSAGTQVTLDFPAQTSLTSPDEGQANNEATLKGKMSVDGGIDTGGAMNLNLAGLNNRTVSVQEPLLCPPFNPFGKVTSGLPGYLPWKWMSPVIPNIDRLEIDLQFSPDTLSPGALYYRYSEDAAIREISINTANFQAHLLLYWYEIPSTMSIPRQIRLQTWNMREFIDAVPGSPLADGTVVQVTGNLLQLRSVPTLITIHARKDNDNAVGYRARNMFRDDDAAGTGATVNDGINSLDSFMEIVDLTVILGDRPNVISPTFTSRELYQLTLKNSKYDGFSLSYADWVGRVVQGTVLTGGVTPTAANIIQQSKAFIALQPKDIAEKVSSGVFFPTSLQFVVRLRARSDANGLNTGVAKGYRMFTHVYVGKHWLEIEPDRAQYQEQNIPLESALRASKPSLVSDTSIGSLRNLSDSAYTSKF